MDIRRLEIFLAVYKQKGYSSAAKKMSLTQSAVSQQIKAFEKELEVELFDLDDRAKPTAAADYLYEEGTRLIAYMDDIENGIRHVSGIGSGTVRFGMIDVAAVWLMPSVIGKFRETYPKVKIEAVVKTTGELIDLVERHDLDFAVAITNRINENLTRKKIYSDSIVAVVPSNSRLNKKQISVRDLKGEPLILYPVTSYSRTIIEDQFRSHGVVPTIAMEMHYPAAIVSLVRQGTGVGLVSALSAREMKLKGQTIVPIEELKGARKIGIVAHKGRRLSPQAKALVEMIEKNV